jgi:hypothetical protein
MTAPTRSDNDHAPRGLRVRPGGGGRRRTLGHKDAAIANCRPEKSESRKRGRACCLSRKNREAGVVPGTTHLAVNDNALAKWAAKMRARGAQRTVSPLVLSQYDGLATETSSDRAVCGSLRKLDSLFEIGLGVIVQDCPLSRPAAATDGSVYLASRIAGLVGCQQYIDRRKLHGLPRPAHGRVRAKGG